MNEKITKCMFARFRPSLASWAHWANDNGLYAKIEKLKSHKVVNYRSNHFVLKVWGFESYDDPRMVTMGNIDNFRSANEKNEDVAYAQEEVIRHVVRGKGAKRKVAL